MPGAFAVHPWAPGNGVANTGEVKLTRTSRAVWAWGVLACTIILPPAAECDLIRTLRYDAGELVVIPFEEYDRVSLGRLPLVGEGAEPALPVDARVFDLAPGERITQVEILDIERTTIPGRFRIAPADRVLLDLRTEGAGETVGSDLFPASPVVKGLPGAWDGRQLGSILVYPLQWVPDRQELVLNERITVRIRTHSTSEEPPVRRLTSTRGWTSSRPLSFSVTDGGPKAKPVDAGGRAQFFRLDDLTVEYLIITDETMVEEFQRLADWKTAGGMPARVITLDWIISRYPIGVDLQERIRAFIRDTYQYWGTRWVLLGADTDILPARICQFNQHPFVGYEKGAVTCDYYYACLDGNWNGDGDEIFGEQDSSPELDLYPEVCLGRAPVNDPEEARIFVDKVLRYRKTPALDYQDRALLISQLLDVREVCPGSFHLGQYLRDWELWFPPDLDVKRLYECSTSFADAEDLNLDAAFREMDAGYGLVCQIGHGDQFKMDCISDYFRRVHADSLSNADRLSFYVLLNCSTCNIDVDCLAERLVRSDRGGAVAFVGNTAYGFPSTANGYMEHMMELLYGRGVTTPGELTAYFRLPYAASAGGSLNHRWTQFSYLLLGDPSVDLWTDTPKTLSVSHPGAVTLTDSTYEVSVESDGAPVPGIRACLWMRETGAYARGITDVDGCVSLPFIAGGTGRASLVVIGPGYLPVEDSVSVAGSGRLRVSGVEVDDLFGGNADGVWDAGETVDLSVTLANDGESDVGAVDAELGRVAGGTLNVDVEIDGVRDPQKIWLGAGGWHPASVPFNIGVGGDSILGQPPLSSESLEGLMLWLDARGWHVRCRSGRDSVRTRGTLTADGGVLSGFFRGIGAGDSLDIEGGVLHFSCDMDSSNTEDILDFRMGDSVAVRVVTAEQSLGALAAAGEATARFTVECEPSVPDRRFAWFVLDVTADGLTSSEWIRTDIRGPRLDVLYGRIEDALGNGDGRVDPGEQVEIVPALMNWGSGDALGVDLVLRSRSGDGVPDSTVTVGAAPAGAPVEAEEGFTLQAASSDPTVEIDIRVGGAIVGRDTLTLGSIARPGSLWYEPGPERIRLVLSRADSLALHGYRILRRESSKGEFEFLDLAIGSSAYLDPDVRDDRSYDYAVAQFDSLGALSPVAELTAVCANPPVQEGFPVDSGESYGAPAVADLDRDGDLEIVVGTKDGQVIAFHHDGTLVGGWPQNAGHEVWGSPALGDLDGDGDLEVVAGSIGRRMWVWNWDGTVFGASHNPGFPDDAPGWPRTAASQFRSAPTLADLDGDGRLEILASCLANGVYCWRYDGSGFGADTTGIFGSAPRGVWGSPAVADLDNDGTLEIVVGDWPGGGESGNGQIFVWSRDGTDFPAGKTNPFAEVDGPIWTSPAVGNLDSDPDLEIVIGSDGGKIYAWNPDGTGLLEASGLLAGLYERPVLGQRIRSSPALGNIDEDPDLEIVVGSDQSFSSVDTVYAWNADGSGALPGGTAVLGIVGKSSEYTPSGPVLADLDGDGEQEILFAGQDGNVYAWSCDGTLLEGWPLHTRLMNYATPTVADLEGDGDLELVIGAYDAQMHVWDFPDPHGDVEWMSVQHGPWHTGLHGFSPPPDTTRPEIEIGVLQNPVMERSLDLYFSSTENLTGLPTATLMFAADPDTLHPTHLSPGVRDLHLYYSEFWASESQTGVSDVEVWGADVGGNEGRATRQFVLEKISAAEGGAILAADGQALLLLPPGALSEDRTLLVARTSVGCGPVSGSARAERDVPSNPRYAIGPEGKKLAGKAIVMLKVPEHRAPEIDHLALCELSGDRWIPVPQADARPGWIGGEIERFGVFGLRFMEQSEHIAKTGITSNYPNPFNPETTIHFTLARGGMVKLTVHDVEGRRVATLVDREMPAGVHRVTWDGRNGRGRSVASGIYFCRLVAGRESSTAKLVLLK